MISRSRSPPKGDHSKHERKATPPNEGKVKTYYDLKTIARKFLKYGKVKVILMHLQNTLIYYAKNKKEKIEVKALMELIKEEGVAEVTGTEEKT